MKTLITAAILAAISTNAMAASFTGSCEYNQDRSYTYLQVDGTGPMLIIDENSDIQSGTLEFEFATHMDGWNKVEIDTAKIASPTAWKDHKVSKDYRNYSVVLPQDYGYSIQLTMLGSSIYSIGEGNMNTTDSKLAISFSNDEDDNIYHEEVIGYSYRGESTYDVITNVGTIRYYGEIKKKTFSSISSCEITEIEG